MKRRAAWRTRAERLRAAPLEPLAARLGYRRDPSNRARWKRPGSVLSISGEKFFDHRSGRGGGGAIDLVMQARRCRFREAAEFLEALGAGPGPRPPAPARRAVPRLPARDEGRWSRVRRYLAQERGLDPRLLRLCRRARILYADRRGNAVFVCRDPARAVTGAEIVGTRPGNAFKAMAPGSRKRRGGFWLPHAPPPLRSALLAESAIDALSAQQLLDPRRRCPALFLSTAGVASRLPPWLPPFRCQLLFCGYDNDAAGDRAANALGRRHPALLRLRPPADANDWNDHLRTTRA